MYVILGNVMVYEIRVDNYGGKKLHNSTALATVEFKILSVKRTLTTQVTVICITPTAAAPCQSNNANIHFPSYCANKPFFKAFSFVSYHFMAASYFLDIFLKQIMPLKVIRTKWWGHSLV